MTDHTDPSGPSDTLEELTGREDGVWNVVTRDSVHRFDFTAGTVTRIPGPQAHPGINDVTRPLKRIYECRVNGRGYWTMHADDWQTDLYWQHSSVITQIERVADPSTSLSVEPVAEGEE